MSVMWIPAQTTAPPFATASSAAGTSGPGRREDDRRVEFLRRTLVGGAGPLGAELERQRLRRLVPRTREGEDAPALAARELRDDVRGGAEAVEAEPLRVPGEAQRAVA